ncbi:hypothetical protein [Gimesia aquarii]|uniref:Carboxypeptidase regulatory-like domain-containing protein n=1 Tax=Gimesia aquarii TaxID=2527964 RepID=A0A517VV32_9PLAN|nr:hypothetical protein [Gimesia aquarii]QDT96872.1 hypothetical protein V144x_23410 [Gimesia aquarii]
MKLAFCLIICSLFVLTGCGGDGRPTLVPVDGSVTLDGQPLDGATIAFIPNEGNPIQRGSNANSTSGGKFTVGTYAKDDGIPVGSYKVTVIKKELVSKLTDDFNSEDPAASSKPIKYKWITPQSYSVPEESGLTIEITSEGMSPSTIALTSDGASPVIETVGGRAANEP